MRFDQHFLDDLRDRVSISSLIGSYVTFDKRSSNPARGDFWACCPFHGEKTPSFHCVDPKGIYHCFGCGVTGDHFGFLIEQAGMSFPDAVEHVANMAGVAVPARNPEEEKRAAKRASLSEVLDMAAQFYEAALASSEGSAAMSYLRERGLSPATIKRFRLGFAPDARNRLKEHLASKSVTAEQMQATGLTVIGQDNPVSYDFLRNRITFPITDVRGRVIAFGGRALNSEVKAKYINSPATDLFDKSRVLYNLGPAKLAAQKAKSINVVEGYMDVIALAQGGIENAVAPLGTALTAEHLEILWRVTPEPVLCFDGDGAGMRAAIKSAEAILPSAGAERSARFAIMPNEKDPDDLIREGGKKAVEQVLNDARTLADIIWLRETQGVALDTPEQRARLEAAVNEAVAQIKDQGFRRHFQSDMRQRLNRSRRGPSPLKKSGHRLNVSEALKRSALFSQQNPITLREATILVGLVRDPALLMRLSDEVGKMAMNNRVMLDMLSEASLAVATNSATDTGNLETLFRKMRLERVWQEAVAIVDRSGVSVDADVIEEAMVEFHRSTALEDDLRAAEAEFASDPTNENYQRLLDIKRMIHAA